MPGTLTFKPLAASLNINKKADPYCTFILGDKAAESKPSGMGGKNPHWEDTITLEVQDQARCVVELKDQKNRTPKGYIGNFEIDLREVETNKKLRKWFTVVNQQNKTAGEILLEASYMEDHEDSKDLSQPEEKEKAPQGTVPSCLDMEKTPFEMDKRAVEAENSIAKMAETNEFGDYTPEKQLTWGNPKREYGSGMIQQGNYYSGVQTSYGEAFPMAQKSVGFDHVPTIEEYGVTIARGNNPTDYARWMNQAFVPHPKETTVFDSHSVIEKAYYNNKKEDWRKQAVVLPTIRLAGPVGYSGNEGASPNKYATEKSLDEKDRDFEGSQISGRTFGSETQDTSRHESMADIIAREQDVSKGVGQPTPHGMPGDPDSDHTAFRDIKNTKRDF